MANGLALGRYHICAPAHEGVDHSFGRVLGCAIFRNGHNRAFVELGADDLVKDAGPHVAFLGGNWPWLLKAIDWHLGL